jgi:hypothetical protein
MLVSNQIASQFSHRTISTPASQSVNQYIVQLVSQSVTQSVTLLLVCYLNEGHKLQFANIFIIPADILMYHALFYITRVLISTRILYNVLWIYNGCEGVGQGWLGTIFGPAKLRFTSLIIAIPGNTTDWFITFNQIQFQLRKKIVMVSLSPILQVSNICRERERRGRHRFSPLVL